MIQKIYKNKIAIKNITFIKKLVILIYNFD